MIRVVVNNDIGFAVSEQTIVTTVQRIMHDHDVRQGEVSVAIVSDQTIHRLNREHLRHDYPTDVLSFQLEREANALEGEVIVSADTASRAALEYGWSAADELLLYVTHGTLHLLDYDDHTDQDREIMRSQEVKYLRMAGLDLIAGMDSKGASP
jgi:probable rRNA maturation factor